MTIFWELKKQDTFKWNIKYSNSQFSNEHNIFKFKNSNVWFAPEVSAWAQYQLKNITAFISSVVISACNYDSLLDRPLLWINHNYWINNNKIKNHREPTEQLFPYFNSLNYETLQLTVLLFAKSISLKKEGPYASCKIYQLFNVHK